MNENDLFNKDSMFWREVNATLPYGLAEIELYEAEMVRGESMTTINCNLLPFEDEKVEYEMENGGSFLKTEVKSWPLVLLTDLEFYSNENNSKADRDAKVLRLPHVQVKSITIKDSKGVVLCKKTKL
ncbi:MAG: hypothetical protein BM555_06610 [Crocinitomix sp. MedPE-SWsnd]|nr:MAG: hypothetical protein BM555_06610 [Crocinitomix sp. MedPE-SWsnd]